IDNDMADQLLRQGVATPHFVAAVLAIDVETPVFSARRAELRRFVPEKFDFKPTPDGVDPITLSHVADDDKLTLAVIQAIEESNPPLGSAAAEFSDLLKSQDARETLKAKVKAHFDRVNERLSSSDPAVRKDELRRLYRKAVGVRKALVADPVFEALDETGGQLLLPLPAD
ncbi:MAG: hypothetical protein KY475_20035, partial [Planctomycetes bacterium]|nr:hypothetical protein [Planctomycetota bacterium]